jgi:hypothetical protein
MDSERFDTITRTLASGMSRRGVLRTLGGVSAGGVLAVVGRGTVAAKGRPCKNGGDPCGKGKDFRCCPSNEMCTYGACVTCAPSSTPNCIAGAPGAVECCSRVCYNTGGDSADSYCG